MGPSLHPDVGLTDLNSPFADTVPAEFASGLGLEIKGTCANGFRAALVNRLQTSYRRVVGESIGSPPGETPVLTLSASDEAPEEVCNVELKYQGENVYGVRASALNMDFAGDDVGRVVGQFYLDVENAHVERVGPAPPPPRDVPPFRHALYFSGARQLEYSGGRKGWGWVVGESALIAAGITFTAASIIERNNATPLDPNTEASKAYQGTAYGAVAAILPLRLFAGTMLRKEAR